MAHTQCYLLYLQFTAHFCTVIGLIMAHKIHGLCSKKLVKFIGEKKGKSLTCMKVDTWWPYMAHSTYYVFAVPAVYSSFLYFPSSVQTGNVCIILCIVLRLTEILLNTYYYLIMVKVGFYLYNKTRSYSWAYSNNYSCFRLTK